MSRPPYDLLIKNVRVVRPQGNVVHEADIAVAEGRFAKVAPGIDPALARQVHDGRGQLAFPGVVDAHMHSGIYSPLDEDAVSESKAAAMGGVTSSLNYFRTGQYYLNKGGPYRDFYPEVLKTSEGRFHVDYGFHLAPMDRTHIDEIPMLIDKHGVSSFKIFMFYGSHGLHGASNSQREFLMIGEDERYDYAHFEFIMRGIQKAREQFPERARQISLSLHCETAEIMTAYTRLVEKDKSLQGLAAYSASRPQHSEGLAVFIASYLAHETALPTINLLHLSSRKAVQAALMMAEVFPHIDFRREVTIGHLMLDINAKAAELAKVNPPIRPREDVEFLWDALLAGELDWVVSDHACCRHETKVPRRYFGNIWMAKSGFGGTEYLLPALVSEGTRRGMGYNHMARVTSWAPAQRFGLNRKGDITEGFDADIALVDPARSWTIQAKDSPSTQGYTPFEGLELSARVEATYLRGEQIYAHDRGVIGKPRGQYLFRPTA
ncbi:dihydroorotase [Ramlibacter tataouinensis]|uniref:Allantoinase-like protein n=1 Tax=Ramlibacter tataouinensis (strain ATCC BAA-407 / DSM 14655 / LMG 21543 / TTB310) TaxID=365046 RepID=F5XWI1_RAMTT|nr:dihydroorotase family protein [Ramlibacter tataouinensis]AEG92935.1 allantoinase-like protein [Ramlibacter tataouinensis TTB310]